MKPRRREGADQRRRSQRKTPPSAMQHCRKHHVVCSRAIHVVRRTPLQSSIPEAARAPVRFPGRLRARRRRNQRFAFKSARNRVNSGESRRICPPAASNRSTVESGRLKVVMRLRKKERSAALAIASNPTCMR